MRDRIEATLDRFGVRFDTWFSERSLHEGGKIEAAIADLRGRGHVYDSDGAVWLRTSELGDDKDRVLIRSDGEPTYFAADIAYHRDKLERGAERMIDPRRRRSPRLRAADAGGDRGAGPRPGQLRGADHAARPPGRGRRAGAGCRSERASSRLLDELIDDIGVDAARFFMLQRSHDTALDLDLELARCESQDNPVYYVQYAHARIASILRKAVAEGSAAALRRRLADEAALVEAARRRGARARPPSRPSARWSSGCWTSRPRPAGAAERRAPHRLVAFATATAADFHAFYRDCQVVGAPGGVEPGPAGGLPGGEAGRRAHPRSARGQRTRADVGGRCAALSSSQARRSRAQAPEVSRGRRSSRIADRARETGEGRGAAGVRRGRGPAAAGPHG